MYIPLKQTSNHLLVNVYLSKTYNYTCKLFTTILTGKHFPLEAAKKEKNSIGKLKLQFNEDIKSKKAEQHIESSLHEQEDQC